MKEPNVVAGKWSFSEVREWIIHSNEGLTLLYCLSKFPFESKSILKITPLVKIDCSYQYLFPNSIRKWNTENTGYSTPLHGCCQGVLNPISAVVNSPYRVIALSSVSCLPYLGLYFPFRGPFMFNICRVCVQYESFNNFENDTNNESVNEIKLTGFWATGRTVLPFSRIFFQARKVIETFAKRSSVRVLL